MFAYCGNNPANRSDATGDYWTAVGIGALASVTAAAVASWITGEEFTFGDALGAALEGAATVILTTAGLSVWLANPMATLTGETWGMIANRNISGEAMLEVLDKTARTVVFTALSWVGGWVLSGYAQTYTSGKFLKLNAFDSIIHDVTYQAKYISESGLGAIISGNVWESAKSICCEVAVHIVKGVV